MPVQHLPPGGGGGIPYPTAAGFQQSHPMQQPYPMQQLSAYPQQPPPQLPPQQQPSAALHLPQGVPNSPPPVQQHPPTIQMPQNPYPPRGDPASAGSAVPHVQVPPAVSPVAVPPIPVTAAAHPAPHDYGSHHPSQPYASQTAPPQWAHPAPQQQEVAMASNRGRGAPTAHPQQQTGGAGALQQGRRSSRDAVR